MVRRIAALLALGSALDASYLAVKATPLALAPPAVPTPMPVPVPTGPFQATADEEE